MAKTKSLVGDLINFRGLVYSPVNENGVIFLFGKVAQDLNMYVEEIKLGFPDCVGRRFNGRGWERVGIEFEFQSSNFRDHGHDPKECDLIVCWDHNWPTCPVEVIALKDIIPTLPNPRIARPDGISRPDVPVDTFIRKFQPPIEALVSKTRDIIVGQSPEIWVNHNNKDMLTFYSPKRVFVYLHVQKKQLHMNVFTRGKATKGVEPYGYERGGAKWGRFIIRGENDLESVKAIVKISFERIKAAVAANENTGWFASMDEDSEEK